MSPLTVPITTLPTDSTPEADRMGRSISMPAFMALAASSTSGTKRMPSRKIYPHDPHALYQRIVQHLLGIPGPLQ